MIIAACFTIGVLQAHPDLLDQDSRGRFSLVSSKIRQHEHATYDNRPSNRYDTFKGPEQEPYYPPNGQWDGKEGDQNGAEQDKNSKAGILSS